MARALRLPPLVPDVIEAIPDEKQGPELTLERVLDRLQGVVRRAAAVFPTLFSTCV
jgi:hypothetical protein